MAEPLHIPPDLDQTGQYISSQGKQLKDQAEQCQSVTDGYKDLLPDVLHRTVIDVAFNHLKQDLDFFGDEWNKAGQILYQVATTFHDLDTTDLNAFTQSYQ